MILSSMQENDEENALHSKLSNRELLCEFSSLKRQAKFGVEINWHKTIQN